ncbi:MAG TPA: sensor histidine kinase [Segeticoccus sp.]|nr:sensor histidine kinase [Segeticoccus sp.]
MRDVLAAQTELAPIDVEWLRLLVGDWQLLSDLSFADLVLWVPARDDGWVVAAHVRPTTGPMVFVEDLLGSHLAPGQRPNLDEAYAGRRIVRGREPEWREDMPVREEAIPVVRAGHPIAVISRHTNLATMRTPSRLEVTYLATADALARMICAGDFPVRDAATGMRRGAPRVGDGVIRIDAGGTVTYASPNAVSALHRLGHLGEVVGADLARLVAELLPEHETVDEGLVLVTTGRAPWRAEVESRAAAVSLRAIPLTEAGRRAGALVLLREVSELRRRERELLTKDATIREIHHRVKNNLQTVAALLRLQSRRLPDETADPPEGTGGGRQHGAGAALAEAVRRVDTIALVHETLSRQFDETVEFDEVAVRLLRAAADVASREGPVRVRHTGSFGRVRAEDATALAMVLAELVHNAIEHGVRAGGEVCVEARREPGEELEVLRVTVADDGRGLPEGFDPGRGGLGTRIVTSFVQDLRGEISWANGPAGPDTAKPRGTVVRFLARLRPVGAGKVSGGAEP